MRSPHVLALLAALLLTPRPALAGARLEGLPEEVRAGDRIEIRWSGLGLDVEEVELELSVAGSRWMRISPEMEALERRFVWQVGGGLSGPAKVRLRAGGERGEREIANVSLRIAAPPVAEPAAILQWPDGWDLDRCTGPAAGDALAAAHARLSLLCDVFEVGLPSPAGLEHDERPPLARETSARARGSATGSARAFRAPRRSPLRN